MTPLNGIRVIDLSRVVAGPYCTMTLGDMGANVIKIEQPGSGDESRLFGPPFLGGESPYFLSINRNKRSCTINLKSSDGQQILKRLLRDADVLVENFRPGTMERLGFDYKTLAEQHPRLIYCSISGFGDTGPDAGRAGYDLIVQGESGLMDITGEAGGPPTRIGTSIADLTTGLMATQGILLGLYARKDTGRGQYVKISMLDAVTSLLTYNSGIYFASGISPTRRGNDHPSVVPYQTFEAMDGWINLGIANDVLWERYCNAVTRPDLNNDPRYSTAPARVTNRDTLVPIIAALTKTKPVQGWIDLLGEVGVPCGRIRTVAEACTNPQLIQRGKIITETHRTAGPIKMIAQPIDLSDTPADTTAPPPLLGEHTEDILREVGYADTDIAHFRALGVI